MQAVGVKPLIKWPGGKRFLSQRLAEALQSHAFGRYFEPFAGGAALFFSLLPYHANLSDTNTDLINLYHTIRDHPQQVLRELQSSRYTNSEYSYYDIRDSAPRSSVRRAARLYYLMRLSFNGIYRENLNGDFNVPYSYKFGFPAYDTDAIMAASRALSSATIENRDFRDACLEIRRNDLVYFDPPYTTTHNTNGFIKYNRTLFRFDDQIALAMLASDLATRGVSVIVSNADHPAIHRLYATTPLKRITITRASRIAANGDNRRPITESLFITSNISKRIEGALCK